MLREIQNQIDEIKHTQEKLERESAERLNKMKIINNRSEEASIKIFANWREYLHKYYLIILAIIGGTGIFNYNIKVNDPCLIIYGIYSALGGLLIGFFIINLYFYFERKRLQINTKLEITEPYQFYEHPSVKDNIGLAMKLNIRGKIRENEQKLKEIKKIGDKKEEDYLKRLIKGDKKFIKLLKYSGGQFGFIERIWIMGVILSMILTFIGMILIFMAII